MNLKSMEREYYRLHRAAADSQTGLTGAVSVALHLAAFSVAQFGPLLQLAAGMRESMAALEAENTDLQAQLLQAQSGQPVSACCEQRNACGAGRPPAAQYTIDTTGAGSLQVIDDLQPPRPPVAEAATDAADDPQDGYSPD